MNPTKESIIERLLNLLKNYLKGEEPSSDNTTDRIPAPKGLEKRSKKQVHEILKKQIPSWDAQKPAVYLADYDYWVTSKSEIERFLAQDKTDLGEYISERHDCDDFSFELLGAISTPGWGDLAFFLVWGGRHAYNAFIDENDKLWFIEPQSDAIIEPDEAPSNFRPPFLVVG